MEKSEITVVWEHSDDPEGSGYAHLLVDPGQIITVSPETARLIEAALQSPDALYEAEKLLREIRDGKHSIPGVLTQIDRYFDTRAEHGELMGR